jgi:tetratricopeptide (TPR) repeat protein
MSLATSKSLIIGGGLSKNAVQLSGSKLRLIFFLSLAASISAGAMPPTSIAENFDAPTHPSTESAETARPVNDDPLIQTAFDHFYNMDYDRAILEFQRVLDRNPNDPAAVNHLLSVTLMRELYRMGAMNTGEYSNDSFIGQSHRPADPQVKEQIKNLVSRAESIEDERLKADPNNVNVLYDRGVTRAQFSLYTALVERAWLSALRNAVGARRDHERVLELDPNYVDAKLVVGTNQYVVGNLPWSVKAAVSMVGLGGTKEKGLEYLHQVANSGGENSVDAKVVLSLFLRREHRYDEARAYMHEMAGRYPRNYLFPLEEANLLRASGHIPEAATTYRSVWQNGRSGKYGALHYEVASWGLGELLRSQKDYAGAAAAYDQVSQVSDPDPEILQKANLAAGEMYDMLQKRDLAMKKYETVIAENASSPPAEQARRHIKEAYRE